MSVDKLYELCESLQKDSWVAVNQVGNLAIFVGDERKYNGFINFNDGTVELLEDENE